MAIYVRFQFRFLRYSLRRLIGSGSITTIRAQHALARNRPRKSPFAKFKRPENDPAPRVYARDVVRNISNILRYSPWDSAEEQLRNLSIKWDSYTINQVLKTHPPMEKAWLFFCWTARLKGFKHDQYTYTTMLDIFGEARRISSMNFLFQQMQEKGIKIDAVTYTSVLHWLSHDGDIEGSVAVWKKMRAAGCRPTVVSYTAYMKVLFDHGRLKEATEIFKEMLQSGCSPNCFTYTVLMEHLADTGKYKSLLEVFNKMQEAGVQPDKATCNILIHKCSLAGEIQVATHILHYMKTNSLVLRHPVYVEALESFKSAGEIDRLLREVNGHISHDYIREEEVKSTGSDAHLTVDRGLIDMFLIKENVAALDSILSDTMKSEVQLDSESLANIIDLNCRHSRISGAMLAVRYCLLMKISIERPTYLTLIGTLIRDNSLDEVSVIVEEMIKGGHPLGTHQAALLIYRFGYARRSLAAAKVFQLLPEDEKDSVTFSALIASYVFCGNIDKGIKIHEEMLNKGIPSTLGTYNLILAGLHKCGRVRDLEVYARKKKAMKSKLHTQDRLVMAQTVCNTIFEHGMYD
uniref:Pentatricopeptide repeat-containing protein n=1 Tax=Kalanchoe fedtschenkoi TaxID=63787 RepID=A0A7N0US03_KALFE